MDNQLWDELLQLEVWAKGTAERAARLREKLQPVSTGSSKKNKATERLEAKMAHMLAKKHKRINARMAGK